MRCLALATAARDAGHDVEFVTADGPGTLIPRLRAEGFDPAIVQPTAPQERAPVEDWRPMSVAEDVACVAPHAAGADWLVLDHYGLGGAWVRGMRRAAPDARILALDDLDREPLFADILLDPTPVSRDRTHPRLALLGGPQHALLRAEFAALRGIPRTDGNTLLVLPGMMDAAGLAPAALDALRDFEDLKVDVIMGSAAQSRAEVAAMVAGRPNWRLHLDVTDMAARMAAATYCIGAGGGTAWERCCLGLASVAVAVSDNQIAGVDALAEAGAAIGLYSDALQNPARMTAAVADMIARRAALSSAAAALCDGRGADRVLAAMSGALRPITTADARQLFEWRNQPHIRAASITSAPLDWDSHVAYVGRITAPTAPGLWRIYQESGVDLGHVNAQPTEAGGWRWSFYIGAKDAPAGAGKRMLTAFLRTLLRETAFTTLHAQVVAANMVSIRLHEALGFARDWEIDGETLAFTLPRCDVETRFGLTMDMGE